VNHHIFQKQFRRGRQAVSDWEKAVEESVKEHPMFYIGATLAGVGLVSLLAAGIMLKRQKG